MTYPCKKKPATNLQNGRAGKSSRSFPKKAFPVLRNARRREKGEDSDSYSPHALLCGKVFCAHCGNRLNITSSGRTRLRADGSTVKEKRFRYSCHYNVRHPGQCDGQSGYGVTKLDAIVESIVLRSSSMFHWRSLKNLRVIHSRCVLRVGGKRTLNKHPLGGWVLRMGESSFLTKLLVKL